MILLKIFLHGKPGSYLPLEGKTVVNPLLIKIYADQLKDHLYSVANTVNVLQKNGWYMLKSYGTMYYLEYCKFNTNIDTVKEELHNLGISESQLVIEELDLENTN